MERPTLELVDFLRRCLERWSLSSRSRLRFALEGERRALASVWDEATLAQAVVRLAEAAALGSPPSTTIRVLVAAPADAGGVPGWISVTFSANGGSPRRRSAREEKDLRDAYWSELTRVSLLARGLGCRVVTPGGEGVGAAVVLCLPAAEVRPERVRSDASDLADSDRPVHILLLEDNPETRWAMAEILAKEHYSVTEAASVEEARHLARVRTVPYRLIIGDLILGIAEGVAVLMELSAQLGNAPVLVVTGRKLEPESRERLDAARLQWLQKPFSGYDLLRRVGALVSADSHSGKADETPSS
jgi:CheY-like chemotaxis protein